MDFIGQTSWTKNLCEPQRHETLNVGFRILTEFARHVKPILHQWGNSSLAVSVHAGYNRPTAEALYVVSQAFAPRAESDWAVGLNSHSPRAPGASLLN